MIFSNKKYYSFSIDEMNQQIQNQMEKMIKIIWKAHKL